MKKKISIVAGGTGGHFFPALAIALRLRNKDDYKVNMFLDHRAFSKYANTIKNDCPVNKIMVIGLYKKNPLFLCKMLTILCLGFLQSIFFLIINRTSIVITFGGYTSVPVGIAVRFINFFKKLFRCKCILLIIHEQNALLGKANKLLGNYANKILLTFENTNELPEEVKKRSVIVGLPVREIFYSLNSNEEKNNHASKDNKIKVLILGGSLGAKIFSHTIPEVFTKLNIDEQEKFVVYHQCREEYIDDVNNLWKKSKTQAYTASFFKDIANIMQHVNVIFTRAGASTISEINILGKYAIYIPFKQAAGNHQYYNALSAVQNHAASLISEDDFSEQILLKHLKKFCIDGYLLKKEKMSFSLRNKNNATDMIEKEIAKLFL